MLNETILHGYLTRPADIAEDWAVTAEADMVVGLVNMDRSAVTAPSSESDHQKNN